MNITTTDRIRYNVWLITDHTRYKVWLSNWSQSSLKFVVESGHRVNLCSAFTRNARGEFVPILKVVPLKQQQSNVEQYMRARKRWPAWLARANVIGLYALKIRWLDIVVQFPVLNVWQNNRARSWLYSFDNAFFILKPKRLWSIVYMYILVRLHLNGAGVYVCR